MTSPARPISSSTALCGIILHPAGHTRSPAMHNAAFRALGVDAVYLAFDVPPRLAGRRRGGACAPWECGSSPSPPPQGGGDGVPRRLDETARRIGAVNTVTREGDRLRGANTDWLGRGAALESQGRCKLAGRRAVVLGAGGAARAATFGLLERGAVVTVLNRSEGRAVELATELGAQNAGGLGELAATEYDVLVNATSVGLGPTPRRSQRRRCGTERS